MPRKRTASKGLPRRVYLSKGWLFFVGVSGKWHKLGKPDERGHMTAEAHRALAEIIDDDGTKVAALLERYEREVLPTKAPKTQTDQRNQLKQLAAVFGKMEPGQIKPVHIAGFLDAHPSPYSANRCIALLSHVYTKALRWGMAEANPCRGVERNPEKPSGRLVTEEEFWRAWEIAPAHVQLLMELALVTGQRLGDLVRIKWADVREDGVYFKQGKTGKRLVVGYSPSLRSVLARAKEGVVSLQWVITNDKGQPYTSAAVSKAWQKLMRKYDGERWTFRHLRNMSGSEHETGEHLGHADQRTLDRFYRLAPKRVTPAI